MDDSASHYLESQILTATPQKLRLLLIEGAIRNARQTIELWERGQYEPAIETLIRCRAIIGELLSGVQVEQSDLTRKVAGVYLFLFRSLTEAHLKRDRQRVWDIIRVLEVEHETWRLVCAQMPDSPLPFQEVLRGPAAPTEILAPAEGVGGPAKCGFSLDA